MSTTDFKWRQLDVLAFAGASAELQGTFGWGELDRLRDFAAPDAASMSAEDKQVRFKARGEQRKAPSGEVQTWLHLQAQTRLPMPCQRCLQAVQVPLDVDRSFRFVHGEAAAAALDETSEDDVLAFPKALDAQALIEDELLLALPLVPRHEECPQPLHRVADDLGDEARENPFAMLASLKRSGKPS